MNFLETAGVLGALLFGTIGAVVSIFALVKKSDVQLTPTPLPVELVDSFVTREDFRAHVTANQAVHRDLFAKIAAAERTGRDASERHLADLRRELNATTSTMHELKGEMKQLTSQLILIQQELSKR
jgi:hypothetical protein